MAALLLLPLLAVPKPGRATEKPIVAVFDIVQKGTSHRTEALDGWTDLLATRLVGCGYQVVPRDQVRLRLQEQKAASYSLGCDEGCRIELGRELAAQKSVLTQLTRTGSSCELIATLVDLKKAVAELGATATAGCQDDLSPAVVEVANQLCEPFRATYPMNPYKKWGHVAFWTGVGLSVFGGVATWQAAEAADDNKAGDREAAERSRTWAAFGFSGLGVGAAALITGAVLWLVAPDDKEYSENHPRLSALPTSGVGLLITLGGRW